MSSNKRAHPATTRSTAAAVPPPEVDDGDEISDEISAASSVVDHDADSTANAAAADATRSPTNPGEWLVVVASQAATIARLEAAATRGVDRMDSVSDAGSGPISSTGQFDAAFASPSSPNGPSAISADIAVLSLQLRLVEAQRELAAYRAGPGSAAVVAPLPAPNDAVIRAAFGSGGLSKVFAPDAKAGTPSVTKDLPAWISSVFGLTGVPNSPNTSEQDAILLTRLGVSAAVRRGLQDAVRAGFTHHPPPSKGGGGGHGV